MSQNSITTKRKFASDGTLESAASSVPSRISELQDEWIHFVKHLAPWKSFITLTFKDDCPYPDKAWMNYYKLISDMNIRMMGKWFQKQYGGSYFSYVVAMEYQKREVPHFHFLVDQFIDMKFIHQQWGFAHGFVYIEKINDVGDVAHYLAKYLLKGGEITSYKKSYSPSQQQVLDNKIFNRMRLLYPSSSINIYRGDTTPLPHHNSALTEAPSLAKPVNMPPAHAPGARGASADSEGSSLPE